MFTGPGCQDQGSANTLLVIRPFMVPFSSTGACLHECLRGPSPGPDSTLPLILTSMTKKHNVWGWRHGQPHEHNMISARSLCPLVTQIRGLLLGVEDIEIRAPTLMTWRDRPSLFNWTKVSISHHLQSVSYCRDREHCITIAFTQQQCSKVIGGVYLLLRRCSIEHKQYPCKCSWSPLHHPRQVSFCPQMVISMWGQSYVTTLTWLLHNNSRESHQRYTGTHYRQMERSNICLCFVSICLCFMQMGSEKKRHEV